LDLFSLAKEGFIDLFFADESGFSLIPPVSYQWQPKNEYIKVVPKKSKRLNVFGIMSEDNRLFSYSKFGSINSKFIIDAIDDFVTKSRWKTIICIDNATLHHSDDFNTKIQEWKQQDLEIFYLPKYSPHLNSIETLWRKIKYEWLKPKHFDNWDSLSEAIQNILENFGKEFSIQFN
jgi:transposase